MGFQFSPSFRQSHGCDYFPDERKTAVCEALPAPVPSHLLKGAVPSAMKNPGAQRTSAVRGSMVGWEGRNRQTLSPASLDNLSQGWEAREPTPPQGGPALLQVREAASTTATTRISAQTPRCPAGLPFHSEQGRPPSSRASASCPGRHSGHRGSRRGTAAGPAASWRLSGQSNVDTGPQGRKEPALPSGSPGPGLRDQGGLKGQEAEGAGQGPGSGRGRPWAP